MRKAFDSKKGPLSDNAVPESEREALAHFLPLRSDPNISLLVENALLSSFLEVYKP